MENQNEKKVPVVAQKIIELLKEHRATYEETDYILRSVREKVRQVMITPDSLK